MTEPQTPPAAPAPSAPNAPQPDAPRPDVRPPHIPVKFWDAQTGAIRVDALLKSYLELERRLSGPADPAVQRSEALKLLGVPETADAYCIRCDHGLFDPDPDLNAQLHGAGFTPDQAQLVYDLAAERLVPLLREMAADLEADREMERLTAHFGGPGPWADVSGQILAWASRNLPAPAVQALAQTADGVIALHRMMDRQEPAALRGDSPPDEAADLNLLVADPRYWRDRDPAFIAKVTEGFRRAYGG